MKSASPRSHTTAHRSRRPRPTQGRGAGGVFSRAPPADAAWAIFFLTGRRLKRVVPSAGLRQWAQEATGCPSGCSTSATPPPATSPSSWRSRSTRSRPARRKRICRSRPGSRIGSCRCRRRTPLGTARPGDAVVARPPARRAIPPEQAADRRVPRRRRADAGRPRAGRWPPESSRPRWPRGSWATGRRPPGGSRPFCRPRPARPTPRSPTRSFLRRRSKGPPEALGDRQEWLVEWKWDGIRAQLVRRSGETWLWSRGEELITHRFPEIAAAATRLPDGTVLDGEVLAFADGRPMPFSALQQRIGRQKQVAQIMRAVPVVFVVYDILERGGDRHPSRRRSSSAVRRAASARSTGGVLRLSEEVDGGDRGTSSPPCVSSRATRGVEGFILKRRDSAVRRRPPQRRVVEVEDRSAHGRRRAHLRAAGKRPAGQPADRLHLRRLGRGRPRARRESLLRAVECEIEETGQMDPAPHPERHGPVRAVEPVQVFELGFEAIAPSSRHKSGIAVRFPACCDGGRTNPPRRPIRSRCL